MQQKTVSLTPENYKMSMVKLVDSLLSKPKNERDSFSKEETKEALKIYKKRIKSWDSYFDKWSQLEANENQQEYEVEQIENWAEEEKSSAEEKSSDEEESEAVEEEHTPEANVSMTEYQKGVVMEKVHEVQKTITHIIDVCDDALCSICGQRTYLPLVYHENLLQAKSLKVICCDDCLIDASGHSECEKESCKRCEKVAAELSNREVIKTEFANGTLIVEEDDEDEMM